MRSDERAHLPDATSRRGRAAGTTSAVERAELESLLALGRAAPRSPLATGERAWIADLFAG